MVKVMPKNDEMRKILKHPSNMVAFREEGPMEWPDDSFTARRIADGDVTVYEEPKPAEAKAAEEVTDESADSPRRKK